MIFSFTLFLLFVVRPKLIIFFKFLLKAISIIHQRIFNFFNQTAAFLTSVLYKILLKGFENILLAFLNNIRFLCQYLLFFKKKFFHNFKIFFYLLFVLLFSFLSLFGCHFLPYFDSFLHNLEFFLELKILFLKFTIFCRKT